MRYPPSAPLSSMPFWYLLDVEFMSMAVDATAEALRKMILAKYSVVSMVTSSMTLTPMAFSLFSS